MSEDLFSQDIDLDKMPLSSRNIKSVLSINSDVIFREINVCGKKSFPISLVYVDGMVHSKTIADNIIKPLMDNDKLCDVRSEKEIIDRIEGGIVYAPAMDTRKSIRDALFDILTGSCALIFDEENIAVTFEVKGFEQRAITEPSEENIIKGPKEAFVENIRVNTAIIRRRLKTSDLVIEQTTVGRRTLTSLGIVYIKTIANDSLVRELKSRLDKIDIDGATGLSFIEEYIIDNKYNMFPQVLATERPDKLSRHLLEGRVGLLIDGIPVAYIIPSVLSDFLRASDDYSQNFIIASFTRILRYISLVLALLLPAFYVAIVTFHQEMIPTELALSIAESKKGVPFPTFAEVLFLLASFEVLLESGLRLPKSIGQTVSIVGALVVGDAAVNAKFISPAVVVVIAITAIAGFTLPNQDLSYVVRICRPILVVFSSILGLIGLTYGIIYLLFYLALMETYGIPYFAPFSSTDGKGLRDSIIVSPPSSVIFRPFMLRPKDKRRQR
ncbi:MAG: spore germination protein [Firmicutes bacterium]|nr:spore germination protein [Bacillota bacterium]